MVFMRNIVKNGDSVNFDVKGVTYTEQLESDCRTCVDIQDSPLLKAGSFNRVELRDIHDTLDATI